MTAADGMPPRIGHAIGSEAIAGMIPHAGRMCLLDRVVHWDEATIRCLSGTHRAAGNPLRTHDELPTVCGIEYASQAMAVHGYLVGAVRERPRAGYLASVRDLVVRRERLDDLPGDLLVEAVRLMGDDDRVLYAFELRCGEEVLLSGRAAVVLQGAGV